MRTTETFELIDACTTTGNYLSGLLEAIQHSHTKISDNALESCIALSLYLERKQASQSAKLYDAIRRLNLVNNAVNGN